MLEQYWPWALTIIIAILILRSVHNKYKRKPQPQSKTGRNATLEEQRFIEKATEDYYANIAIVLSGGEAAMYQHRNHVGLTDDDEIVVQIDILYKERQLLTNCYFSGKCEMFFEEKETSFNGFNLDNITKGLQELGFENIGFSKSSVAVHA